MQRHGCILDATYFQTVLKTGSASSSASGSHWLANQSAVKDGMMQFDEWSIILSRLDDPLDWIRCGCVCTAFRKIIVKRHWSNVHTVTFRKDLYEMEVLLRKGKLLKDGSMSLEDEQISLSYFTNAPFYINCLPRFVEQMKQVRRLIFSVPHHGRDDFTMMAAVIEKVAEATKNLQTVEEICISFAQNNVYEEEYDPLSHLLDAHSSTLKKLSLPLPTVPCSLSVATRDCIKLEQIELSGHCHIEPFIDCVATKTNLKILDMGRMVDAPTSYSTMAIGLVASQAQLTTLRCSF